MGMSGTDYGMYLYFQDQSETYRYQLAQTMNELQIEFIGNRIKNSSDPAARLSQENWQAFPDFHQKFLSAGEVFQNERNSLITLVLWILAAVAFVRIFSNRIPVL
jgi:ABC-2 type transport system permease protein